jgi:hypothetical protein
MISDKGSHLKLIVTSYLLASYAKVDQCISFILCKLHNTKKENRFFTAASTMWNFLALFFGVVGNSGVLSVSVVSNVYSGNAFIRAFPTNEADRTWLLQVADKARRCELLKAPKIETGKPTDLFCAEPKFMQEELRSRGVQGRNSQICIYFFHLFLNSF